MGAVGHDCDGKMLLGRGGCGEHLRGGQRMRMSPSCLKEVHPTCITSGMHADVVCFFVC